MKVIVIIALNAGIKLILEFNYRFVIQHRLEFKQNCEKILLGFIKRFILRFKLSRSS